MRDPFRREPEPSEISEINVVPLADVSLVLLIILLLLSPMIAQSTLHVRTAASDPEPPAPDEDFVYTPRPSPETVLVVDLGPGGIAIADTLFASTAQLAAYLRLDLPRRKDRKVFLAPHPEVSHGDVVAVLESIKAAGASTVALVQTVEAAPPP